MKKTTLGLGGIMLAAALSLTACGGSEEELASEYCKLAKDANDAVEAGDTEKAAEASEALLEWAEENKDVKGDEDKFTDAVKDECGDIANLP